MRFKALPDPGRAGPPVHFDGGSPLRYSAYDELQSIRDSFGAYFTEVVSIFLEDGPKRISAMRRACDQSDLVSLAALTHALNGSAASFGATSLAALCRDLNRKLKAGTRTDTKSDVQSIETEFATLEARLRALDPDSGPTH